MTAMFAQAALGPSLGAGQRLDVVFIGIGQRGQLIKGHVDVCADPALDLHRLFRTDEVLLVGERVTEMDAVFSDAGQALFRIRVGHFLFAVHTDDLADAGAQRHDLESAGIGEGRPVPSGPAGQPAFFSDLFGNVAQVIAVAEHGLRVDVLQIFHGDEAHLALCAHRHEGRGLDVAMRRMDDAGASQLAWDPLDHLKAEAVVVLIFAQPAAEPARDPHFQRGEQKLQPDAQHIREDRLAQEFREGKHAEERDGLEDGRVEHMREGR